MSKVFVVDYGADPTYLRIRERFYADFGLMAFKMGVFLSVCKFKENICDNLTILIYNKNMYKL